MLMTPMSATQNNQFVFVPSMTGQYAFACQAIGATSNAICPTATGTAVASSAVCTNPVTQVTVSSHTTNQTVTSSIVTLTGVIV